MRAETRLQTCGSEEVNKFKGLLHERASPATATFQLAEVTRALCSVSKMCDPRAVLFTFSATGGYVITVQVRRFVSLITYDQGPARFGRHCKPTSAESGITPTRRRAADQEARDLTSTDCVGDTEPKEHERDHRGAGRSHFFVFVRIEDGKTF